MADISIIHEGSTDYYVKDAAGRLALAEVENKGAKNDFDLNTSFPSAIKYHATASKSNGTVSITSTGNYGRCAIPYNFKSGTSVFSCTVSSFAQAGGTSTVRFAQNSDGTSKIAEPITISGNGKYNAEIAVSSDTAGYIILYINGSGDNYANSANFSDLMICTKAEWDISHTYVPYAPTNRELYEEKIGIEDVYGAGTKIDANTNFNDLKSHGLYYSTSAQDIASFTNCPVSSQFTLSVKFGSQAVFQEIQPMSKAEIMYRYVRILTNGTWSSWYKFEGTEVT